MNILVPDIAAVFDKVLNAYLWMLHQIVRHVSFEERCRLIEQQMRKQVQYR
ncbi:MAG: hypothetical protein LBT14_06645 [Treponema sp.]|nr:hypothetical protein [Treponema sp.]